MLNQGDEMEAGDLSAEAPVGQGQNRGGYSVVTNCYEDGTKDVFRHPLIPATEEQYPDGIFGLESSKEALMANIAIQQQAKDFHETERSDMLSAFSETEEAPQQKAQPY